MIDLKTLRVMVLLNGLVPAVMLGCDAFTNGLGANPPNIALHITGAVSLVFLLLSLLITPLRRLTHWGGWVALRRSLGLYGFFYAVLHFVIYVVWDRALNVSSTLHELSMRQFLQIGILALILMIPLAVTSTNDMIRRMGSKAWKRLHRLAYLAAILGVVHYFLLVKSDVRDPLAFGVVLAVLLGSRLVPTAANTKSNGRSAMSSADKAPALGQGAENSRQTKWKGQLQVAEVIMETPDVRTFRLVNPEGGDLPFEHLPGQFISLHLKINDKPVNRSYTLASAPQQRTACELSIKRTTPGVASAFMHDAIKPGDLLSMSGPHGKFVFTGDTATGVVLIAGGVGITPVMSILRSLMNMNWPGEIHFIFVARTQADLMFRRELDSYAARNLRLRLFLTLTQEPSESSWSGPRGRISEDFLQSMSSTLRSYPIYLCGPQEMMTAVREQLQRVGVPAEQIYVEAFSGSKVNVTDRNSTLSAPAAMVAVASDGSSDALATVLFTPSRKTIAASNGSSVLELAEEANIDIPYECRSGICGQCKVRLLEGQVQMDCEDALSRSEKAQGLILACQARPLSSLIVEC